MSGPPRMILAGAALWIVGMALMRLTTPAGVERTPVTIPGPEGRPCHGAIWRPADTPRAVILIGHGVSCNQGVMAAIAKSYAARGYTAVAFDFWGHGRAREPFQWGANAGQVRAWTAWARDAHPGLPLAYLGHSMGGMAGTSALLDDPAAADAFVSLGALPRRFPETKTLVAAGQFEELFSPAQARQAAQGRADVLISPYSNHAMETWDPALIRDMIAWTDAALGLPPGNTFPWGRWLPLPLALVLGVAGAFRLAEGLTALARAPGTAPGPPATTRRWSLNPYRPAARLLRADPQPHTDSQRLRAESLPRALLQGAAFALLLVLALALLLDRDIFTSWPAHPRRALGWAIGSALLLPLFWIDAIALERAAPGSALRHFAAAAITRAAPILLFAIALRAAIPGAAFGAMMIAILAFLAVTAAWVHHRARRAAADPRAGAAAAAITLAWTFAYWFPLVW